MTGDPSIDGRLIEPRYRTKRPAPLVDALTRPDQIATPSPGGRGWED
jgi:hypothetical protein